MTQRTDAPGPNQRRGPRPLLLHLTLAMMRSSVSSASSLNWKHGSPPSSAIGAALRAAVESESADGAFGREVIAETIQQDAALIAGIAAYRRHPSQRSVVEPPSVWEEGDSRILDYGLGSPGAPTVLFVPSLINRAYILDLTMERSLVRRLAAGGIRPLLLDWGWPGERERRFTLTDYVAGRLERALIAATQLAGGPVILAGYCMGGTLAVAAAQRRPDLVRALGLLAAPWDFHADDAAVGPRAALALSLLEPVIAHTGALPVDPLQALFASIDPWGVARKYRAFSRLDPNSSRAGLFVALEDWANDGVPLAGAVARACLGEWYGRNLPALGQWQVAGAAVDPGKIRMPTWAAIAGRDRIVPPCSARALAGLIAGSTMHECAAGHIGMVAGSQAERLLWQPLAAWIHGLPG